ncbi:MAG TPA: ABC transporter permease subunit [Stellaceae bacterium]|nr:ABC transporter permease subunit [Stellaceae bacterium]
MSGRRSLFLPAMLGLGYFFLYGPILSLIVYSFNASRLVTVWAGFSTRWYGELLQNAAIGDAAWTSLRIAAISASAALALGTVAGFVLARISRFRGRGLFAFLLSVPLVLPEVIMGLSLLLLFVDLESAIGWPAGRGLLTIVIAHAALGTAYVAVVVQSRLHSFDRSLEEAALDLGARPLKVFWVITLPIIAPALAAGWLLAFTLSLDDLVLASFTSGPGATTLPMWIFSSVRLGVSPQVNALATIMVAVVTLAAVIAGRLLAGPKAQRQES